MTRPTQYIIKALSGTTYVRFNPFNGVMGWTTEAKYATQYLSEGEAVRVCETHGIGDAVEVVTLEDELL